MRRFVIIGAGLAAFLLAVAVAVSAEAQPRSKAPVTAPEFTHQGFYIGLQAGTGFVNQELTLTGTPLAVSGLAAEGLIYGAHVGYDHRFGFVTAGPFAEFNAQDLDFKVSPGIIAARLGNSWTAGGRIGVPVGNALPYVLAGYTWTDSDISFMGTQISSTTLKGWTLGGGIEYAAMRDVVVGIRYAWTRYENEDLLGAGVLGIDRDQHAVTGRVAYKLDFLK